MNETVLALCKAMGAGEEQMSLLLPLIEASVTGLKSRLKAGTTPEDCGSAFPLAAAMLAMEGLTAAEGGGGVEAFTAGEVSLRMGENRLAMTAQAERLMAPWLGETGFAFVGVSG